MLPFGWENTLAGLQQQWYFLLLFSIGGVVIIVDAKAFTPRWWLATLFLVLSYFSMAGGALTMAAAFAISAAQFAVGRRSGRRDEFGVSSSAAAQNSLLAERFENASDADHSELWMMLHARTESGRPDEVGAAQCPEDLTRTSCLGRPKVTTLR